MSDGDLQISYYNFRSKRLSPATDVFHGDTLVYRTNALGCRGDDLTPGLPVVALIGGDFVHGGRAGGGLDRAAVEGVQMLNAGVEALSVSDCAARAEELAAEINLSAIVFSPPPPAGSAEDWPAALDDALVRLAGLAAVVVVPAPGLEPDLSAAISTVCARRGAPVVRASVERGLLKQAARLFGSGRPSHGDPLIRALEVQIAALRAPMAAAANPAAKPGKAPAAGEFGRESVGRNYPLW